MVGCHRSGGVALTDRANPFDNSMVRVDDPASALLVEDSAVVVV